MCIFKNEINFYRIKVDVQKEAIKFREKLKLRKTYSFSSIYFWQLPFKMSMMITIDIIWAQTPLPRFQRRGLESTQHANFHNESFQISLEIWSAHFLMRKCQTWLSHKIHNLGNIACHARPHPLPCEDFFFLTDLKWASMGGWGAPMVEHEAPGQRPSSTTTACFL